VLQGEREMSANNKTLGRFELVGIAPAPRGMPQVEVTFDIDANGIVEVSAKDQATGKEQSIRITAASGLSKEEIDNLVREAEVHGDEDRQQKALVEARNGADALIYQTEKSLGELGEQVPQDVRGEIEGAVSQLKVALKGDNTDEINRSAEALNQAAQKMAANLYQQQAEQSAAGCAGGTCGSQEGPCDAPGCQDDDVVDAEFQNVA
jgi:molecular chaperone DnaK